MTQLKPSHIYWIILICVVITIVYIKHKKDISPQYQLQPQFLAEHLQTSTSYETNISIKQKNEALSQSTLDSVEKFVFFIGYAKSGHSVIGSILDAHPKVIIAHEYGLFGEWLAHSKLHQNKAWLYNTLYNNSRYNSIHGKRIGVIKRGYTLEIQNSWQGQYQDQVLIIGDKYGDKTTAAYRDNKREFQRAYMELVKTVEVPVLAIHVVRNPYDTISTKLLYNKRVFHAKFNVSDNRPFVDLHGLQVEIGKYFSLVENNVEMINVLDLDVIEIFTEDFISEPSKILQYMCSRLELLCTNDYIQNCSDFVYKHPSRSRNLVKWTPYLIDLVKEKVKRFSFLQRYTFSD